MIPLALLALALAVAVFAALLVVRRRKSIVPRRWVDLGQLLEGIDDRDRRNVLAVVKASPLGQPFLRTVCPARFFLPSNATNNEGAQT